MSDIKTVIALLCKHLKLLYDCDIRNEHFRLAKFNENKDDTVMHFWHLLMKIVEKQEQCIVFKEDNVVNFVKLNFAVMEYNSLQFYALPTDMSSGSRELLLALGWLMSSRDILESATKKKIVHSKISKEFDGSSLNDNRKAALEKQNIISYRSACELILWYAGKIRHNLNAIEELNHEWVNIMTKIHEDTRLTCGLPHLSAGDIKLIHDIQNAKDCKEPNAEVGYLKESVLLIETQKHWHKKDGVFWEWMESVLAEKEQKTSNCLNIEQKQELANFLKILKANVEILVREINRASALGQNIKELFQSDTEVFSGFPRFILQENDETDVETLLHSFSVAISEAEKKLERQLNSASSSLESISKKMSTLTIIDP